MSFNKSWLLVNCVRPKEPSFTPKCNHQFYLDLPDDYFPERYRAIGHNLEDKYARNTQTRIPIARIHVPDLSFVQLDRRGTFSPFVPKHRNIAGKLMSLFMQSKSVEELMALGAYVKDRVNPYMFQYVYQVVLKHHRLSKDLPLPSIVEQFPENFMDPAVFPMLQEETSVLDANDRRVVYLPSNFTATDLEDEQRLAYWREDIGVNMHHWHWHLVYPIEGPLQIVDKDRRGELFYYMHWQLVARYESERLSNGMPKTVQYENFREPVKEGYFPKLVRGTNMRAVAGRAPNTTLKDVNRPDVGIFVSLAEFENWLDQILLAIDQGFVVDTNGQAISIQNEQGIDILGNVIESSILSVNPDLYGDWHNAGHDLFAYAHDPDGRYLEGVGAMGDVTTAMRDPVFYRYHKYVNTLFDRHKRLLPQYNRFQLSYDPVNINHVNVQIPKETAAPNILLTFWQRSQIDLSGGLDFQADGSAFVSFQHLQHADFDYVIDVSNNSSQNLTGTCRIFLAPNCDDNCRELYFNEQRLLMVELDKFTLELTPGDNRIVRSSLASSVTISWEKSFQTIGKLTRLSENATPQEIAELEFCGCGWPHHLLLPKGSPDGAAFRLFVMISNFADDVVNAPNPENVACGDAHSFCGLQDQLYPDARPMGFPFDRPFDVPMLDDFVALHSNMFVQEVTIRFVDEVVNREQ